MNRAMRAALALVLLTSVLGGCGGSDVGVFVTPEGNIAVGPRNAATAPGGEGRGLGDRSPGEPHRHIARSAYDTWRPPPIGVLPPDNLLRNTSEPVTMSAGGIGVMLRTSDRLVPAWGGDYYVRVDLRSGAMSERPAPRDLVVVIDTRDHTSLDRSRRLAAEVFESLRPGDRGGLVTSSNAGQVLVPLYSYAAAPLLVERTGTFEPLPGDDLGAAIQHAVAYLSGGAAERTRRIIVFSSSAAILDADVREWVSVARQSQIDVVLAPLAVGTAIRFQRLAAVTQATALPQLPRDDAAERRAMESLAAVPAVRTVADAVTLSIESLPGPMHLVEVAGARAFWTPSGGEVALGEVRAGEDKTLVLRASVTPWQGGAPFEVRVRVHVHDELGDHEAVRVLTARYTSSPTERAASRSGDVLQYVSLLNTLSNVQAALVRDDPATFGSLREAATLQAHSLGIYAREHQDEIMGEQATLLQQLLDSAPAEWQAMATQ